MKATLPRSEAPKSKKTKAESRPSSPAAPPKRATPVVASPTTAAPASSAKVKASATAVVVSEKATTKRVARVSPPSGVKSTAKSPAGKGKVPTASATPSSAKRPASPAGPPATTVSEPPLAKKPPRKSIKEAAGVSTDAVARRTGKSWDDWFDVLDSAGAATLDQRGIIAILAQKHGIGPWWQQMIAVGYESLRAKSDKPPAADGFHISQTCTLNAPLPRVFKLWNDAGERARWLADERFVLKSATPGKALRARWGKGNSQVAVSFTERAGKTEVAVEHQHIESRSAADQMKAYWQKKLGLLSDALAEST